jgi:DNA-directed RNA polymerase specialized sigma24 family protein
MGAVSYEIEKVQRGVSEKYRMEDPEGVKRVLYDMYELENVQYKRSAFVIVELLEDLRLAIKKADLTDQQRQCIHFRYVKLQDDKRVALQLGVPAEDVERIIDEAVEKIAAVFKEWGYDQY